MCHPLDGQVNHPNVCIGIKSHRHSQVLFSRARAGGNPTFLELFNLVPLVCHHSSCGITEDQRLPQTEGVVEHHDVGLHLEHPLDPSYHYIRNQGFWVYGFSLWNHWLPATSWFNRMPWDM